PGLFFLDAHSDTGTPQTSATGGAAGMDLALATGVGPALLSNIDGQGALVRPADVALLGLRGIGPAGVEALGQAGLRACPRPELRRMGIAAVVRSEIGRLSAQGVKGFWIHLDADVRDDAVMPAVDSRYPGGLSYPELTLALRELLAS